MRSVSSNVSLAEVNFTKVPVPEVGGDPRGIASRS